MSEQEEMKKVIDKQKQDIIETKRELLRQAGYPEDTIEKELNTLEENLTKLFNELYR